MKTSWKKELGSVLRVGEGKWGNNPAREKSINIILKYEISCFGRVGETSMFYAPWTMGRRISGFLFTL